MAGGRLLQGPARLASNLLGCDSETSEYVHTDAFALAHHSQQQMFSANVVVPHSAGFFDAHLQHLLRAWSKLDPAAGVAAYACEPLDHFLDPGWI